VTGRRRGAGFLNTAERAVAPLIAQVLTVFDVITDVMEEDAFGVIGAGKVALRHEAVTAGPVQVRGGLEADCMTWGEQV